jgi:hypothetical protein
MGVSTQHRGFTPQLMAMLMSKIITTHQELGGFHGTLNILRYQSQMIIIFPTENCRLNGK